MPTCPITFRAHLTHDNAAHLSSTFFLGRESIDIAFSMNPNDVKLTSALRVSAQHPSVLPYRTEYGCGDSMRITTNQSSGSVG